MNKTSRKRPRRQNLYSPRKTSTLKLPWPWIVPAAAAHHAASAFFLGPKVKTCQRIRVKSYQNVGFRSSIDYTFWAQPFLVTTHSRFVFFLNQTVKDAKIYRCHPMSSVWLQGNIQQIHCNERKKQLGLRGFGWLRMPLSVVLELNLRILEHPHLVGQFIQLTEEKMRQWMLKKNKTMSPGRFQHWFWWFGHFVS